MGTGISMSSVNKIKELVENGDYSLALDILEHQDLTKSLSPQFIRICGEVYYENQKYAEARATLVRAHSMAPMGNKIIYSIIKLYLSMGLFELAEYYFEIYKYNQEKADAGTYRIEYMLAKAHRKPVNELYSILLSANELESDEAWDFEMLMVHAAMHDKEKFVSDANMFNVTYKGSAKMTDIHAVSKNMEKALDYIYIYPENANEDTDAGMEETRQLEKTILAEDDLRMHPKAPKIMIMVEDDEPLSNSVKFKTMLARSKENKKEKKEKSVEIKEEKKSWFGKNRMAKKDEEAYEEIIDTISEHEVGRQELLNEVLKSDDEQKEENVSDDVSAAVDETKAKDSGVYNTVDEAENVFDDAIDDFNVEEETETVIMVNVDALSEEPLSDEKTADEKAADMEAGGMNFEKTEQELKAGGMNFEKAEQELEAFRFEELEPEESETEFAISEPEEPEPEVTASEPEEPEPEVVVSEPGFTEVETTVDAFDFDSAFESLGGFDISFDEEIPEPKLSIEEEETPEPELPIEEEKIPEPELPIEEEETPEPEPDLSVYKRDIDFPVFRSSLFPDYNRDDYPKPEPVQSKTVEMDLEEEKFQENLKKEEALLSQADKLLAELGIDIGIRNHSDAKSVPLSAGADKEDDITQQNVTEELKSDVKDKRQFKLRF